MAYNHSSSREKWTIMMYMRNFDLMVNYAYALRSSNALTEDNIDEILSRMEEDGIYRPRYGGSTFTGQFKSIQIAWYMFGYYNKSRRRDEEKKMVFSPLGNLLLDNLKDREKVRKIFLTMLIGNGFRQPFSQMDERFNIYAFRLIFKLLRDPRLEGRLYNDEVFYYAMFLKTVDDDTYEQLIEDILILRDRDPFEKLLEYKQNERVIGLACHEWRYATGMLESAGIVDICNDNGNRNIGELSYGNINSSTGRPNAIRHYTEDYIILKRDLIQYIDIMLNEYQYNVRPFPDDELSTRFNNSIVVEMYSFYPPELLRELGLSSETDRAISIMLSIANDVNYYSREEISTGENFEVTLTSAFNMFSDVEARRIGGAGNSDIECLFYVSDTKRKKFDIEAKSTSRKLLQINSRRLETHRQRIGSTYTLVVTPNFSIGALRDIKDQRTVIVKSATLANYFYQYILKDGRNISYFKLNEIIEGNIGGDITDSINDFVFSNFGHTANDLRINR